MRARAATQTAASSCLPGDRAPAPSARRVPAGDSGHHGADRRDDLRSDRDRRRDGRRDGNDTGAGFRATAGCGRRLRRRCGRPLHPMRIQLATRKPPDSRWLALELSVRSIADLFVVDRRRRANCYGRSTDGISCVRVAQCGPHRNRSVRHRNDSERADRRPAKRRTLRRMQPRDRRARKWGCNATTGSGQRASLLSALITCVAFRLVRRANRRIR